MTRAGSPPQIQLSFIAKLFINKLIHIRGPQSRYSLPLFLKPRISRKPRSPLRLCSSQSRRSLSLGSHSGRHISHTHTARAYNPVVASYAPVASRRDTCTSSRSALFVCDDRPKKRKKCRWTIEEIFVGYTSRSQFAGQCSASFFTRARRVSCCWIYYSRRVYRVHLCEYIYETRGNSCASTFLASAQLFHCPLRSLKERGKNLYVQCAGVFVRYLTDAASRRSMPRIRVDAVWYFTDSGFGCSL